MLNTVEMQDLIKEQALTLASLNQRLAILQEDFIELATLKENEITRLHAIIIDQAKTLTKLENKNA